MSEEGTSKALTKEKSAVGRNQERFGRARDIVEKHREERERETWGPCNQAGKQLRGAGGESPEWETRRGSSKFIPVVCTEGSQGGRPRGVRLGAPGVIQRWEQGGLYLECARQGYKGGDGPRNIPQVELTPSPSVRRF